MRNVIVMLFASVLVTVSAQAIAPAPAPLIGLGIPGVIATVGAFIATRRRRK